MGNETVNIPDVLLLVSTEKGPTKGGSKRYAPTALTHYEETSSVDSAIAREKEIKGWVIRR